MFLVPGRAMLSNALLVACLAQIASAESVNAADAHQAVRIVVEVLEFDCLNTTTELVKCNSVMTAARTSVPEVSVLSAVTPKVIKLEYSDLLYPEQLLRGKASSDDTSIDLRISAAQPVDGRYQVDFRAKYVREKNQLTSLSTSLVLAPGDTPQHAGGGMTTRVVKIKRKERQVYKYELVQVRLETP